MNCVPLKLTRSLSVEISPRLCVVQCVLYSTCYQKGSMISFKLLKECDLIPKLQQPQKFVPSLTHSEEEEQELICILLSFHSKPIYTNLGVNLKKQ